MIVEKNKCNLLFNKKIIVNIVDQGVVDGDTTWRFLNVFSPFHRLYYIDEGTVFLRDGSQEYELQSGYFYLIRRNTSMDYYAKDKFKKYFIHLQYSVIGGMDLLDRGANFLVLDLTNVQKKTFFEMFSEDNISTYAGGISVLYKVLQYALKTVKLEDLTYLYEPNPYVSLLNKIDHKANIQMSVTTMAEICGQSVSDFSRKFKSTTGLSPKAYLHNVVLEKSKILLVITNKSIKQIAYELGFNDSLYFSRFFKKYCGLSPLAYRNSQI